MMGLILACSLCGCTGSDRDNALTLELRSDFLARAGCTGTVDLTADYGQRVYRYTADFRETTEEGLTMTLSSPEEVAGITATARAGQTGLEYEGMRLETGPLNGEGLSPMDALPALFAALESGYLAETGTEFFDETEVLRLCCRDPEQPPGEGTETILWFDKAQKTLRRGEIRSDGFTVIQCEFSAFTILPAE